MTVEPHFFAPFRRLLRRGPLMRYLSGEAISMVGTWMQLFAQSYLLTTLTTQAWILGVVNFAGGLPMLLLTMLGGSYADRVDKRRILLAALTLQGTLALLIGWLVATHQIAIWHVVAVTMLLGIIAAFEVPTVAAFVPELVPPEEISRAIALDRSIFHGTRLIGPALGGWVVGRLGVQTAYFLNALTFLALIAAILTISARRRGSAEEEEKRRGPIGEGFRFVESDGPTRAMVLLMAASTIFISPFLMILMPLYSRFALGLDAAGMGALMAVSGIGAFIGSLGLLSIPKGRRAAVLKCAAAMAVLGVCGMAAAQTFSGAAASLIAITLGMSTSYGTANIVIQERAPDPIRGRVSALASLAFFGILPFSGIAMSALADLLSLRGALWCGAAGFAVVAIVLLAGRNRLASAPE